MSDEDLKAELERLKAENERPAASGPPAPSTAVRAIIGSRPGRFPSSGRAGTKLLAMADEGPRVPRMKHDSRIEGQARGIGG